jgi:hypothetical protein
LTITPLISALLIHPLLPLILKTGKTILVTKSTPELGSFSGHISTSNSTFSYYDSYLAFFSWQLVQHGLEPTLENYFFSAEANWGNKEKDKHPEMLSRLLAGLVHPYIFAGHGLEFGQLGMVAEGGDGATDSPTFKLTVNLGFAQAAVHSVPTSKLLSRELLAPPALPSMSLTTALALKLSITSATVPKSSGTHPFNLLARILKDSRLAPKQPAEGIDREGRFEHTIKDRGDVIRQYAEEWDADASSPEAVAQRVKEISWVVTLIYGVGGWGKDRPFKADFYTLATFYHLGVGPDANRLYRRMHLVTSSLFLPSMLAHLTSDSKRTFLRSYFAVILGFWVSQGRPDLDIKGFYADTETNPTAPGPQPTPHPETLDKENTTPNPWYPLLQSTLMHPGEHLLKLERALAHYASLYGTTKKGSFSDTELEGADSLDGTVFLRGAWLSLNRNGWMREGKEKGDWDFDGFF